MMITYMSSIVLYILDIGHPIYYPDITANNE